MIRLELTIFVSQLPGGYTAVGTLNDTTGPGEGSGQAGPHPRLLDAAELAAIYALRDWWETERGRANG